MAEYKIYQYDGKKYCEYDWSLEKDDWGGDLFDLYWQLKKDGVTDETTVYHMNGDYEDVYDNHEELLEKACVGEWIEDLGEYEVDE